MKQPHGLPVMGVVVKAVASFTAGCGLSLSLGSTSTHVLRGGWRPPKSQENGGVGLHGYLPLEEGVLLHFSFPSLKHTYPIANLMKKKQPHRAQIVPFPCVDGAERRVETHL